MSGILNNQEIEQMAYIMKIPFNGCFAKDTLKGTIKNGGYVVNLGDSKTGGSHWVALYCENKNVCYYDSFGAIYPNIIKSFCKNKTILYNVRVIQDLKDNHCGYYCLAFLHYFSTNSNEDFKLSDELNNWNAYFDMGKNSLKKLQKYYKNNF